MRIYACKKGQFVFFFLSLSRSVRYSSWLEPFANVVSKDIFAYDLYRFSRHFYSYAFAWKKCWSLFLHPSFVSLFIVNGKKWGREKESESKWHQTHDITKRVCNNLKIYISYGPNGRFVHKEKKYDGGRRRKHSKFVSM